MTNKIGKIQPSQRKIKKTSSFGVVQKIQTGTKPTHCGTMERTNQVRYEFAVTECRFLFFTIFAIITSQLLFFHSILKLQNSKHFGNKLALEKKNDKESIVARLQILIDDQIPDYYFWSIIKILKALRKHCLILK